MSDLIKIEELSIGYPKREVCKNINATAKRGELIGLCGKNGSGKSTLIRTLLGLQPKLSGRIEFQNENIDSWNLNKRSKEISVVFSRLNRLPALTVYELAALGRLPYSSGFSKITEEENELIENSLEKVGILNLKDRLVTQLSDGQLQMAMIGRALVQDTDLVLMDEPTSHLDIENQFKIFELIYKLSKETNKTFIVASHQIELLIQNANRLWWIDSGEFYSGFPEQLAFERQIFDKLSQQKIKFDYSEGKFKFNHKAVNQVSLNSNGNELSYWVRHALERNGFEISENSNLKIDLNQNQIQLNHLKFDTIEELIRYLKKENDE